MFTLTDKVIRIFIYTNYFPWFLVYSICFHISKLIQFPNHQQNLKWNMQKPPFYAVMIRSKTFVSECNIGYIGPNCSKQCVYPSYGWKCVLECNCSKEDCNFSTGCLVQSFCKSNIVSIIFAIYCNCFSTVQCYMHCTRGCVFFLQHIHEHNYKVMKFKK